MVKSHKFVSETNFKLEKIGLSFNYLTPRDYIDLIAHFTKLYDTKRS
jgi:hypothetical protein